MGSRAVGRDSHGSRWSTGRRCRGRSWSCYAAAGTWHPLPAGRLGCSGGFFEPPPLLPPQRGAPRRPGREVASRSRGRGWREELEPRGEGCSHSAGRPQGWLRVHSPHDGRDLLPGEGCCGPPAAGGDRRLTAARQGRGRDGGRGLAPETGFSATARRHPDRTRRRGGLSAGSTKHLPGEGAEGGQDKTFGLQGDAAAETSCPSVVRRVSRGGKKWERVGSGLLTATADSVRETVWYG